jgi:HK97 family phage portal protein
MNIQRDAAQFFGNRSIPGGILTAPGAISNDTATRLKASWEENYGGDNSGKLAVLGDGLTFEAMRVTASDAQLVEQLRWSSETVASVFHVPLYKIGIGPMPAYNNIQALNTEYYSQALQMLIESAELAMDEGLKTGEGLGTEFDICDLLRMDELTQINVAKEGVGAGILAPNEARRRLNYRPVEGGDTPYLQQQNYSLAALNKRDTREDPFGSPTPALPPPTPQATDEDPEDETEDESTQRFLDGYFSIPRPLFAPEHA